jgi:hypothetical protein
VTDIDDEKPDPLIATPVAPEAGPHVLLRLVIVGGEVGCVYVNWSDALAVEFPDIASTVMSQTPGLCCGDTADIEFAEFTVKDCATTVPNMTAQTCEKLLPAI